MIALNLKSENSFSALKEEFNIISFDKIVQVYYDNIQEWVEFSSPSEIKLAALNTSVGKLKILDEDLNKASTPIKQGNDDIK